MTNLASFIQALFFAALFLTFINADIGWAMVYIIGGISLLSAVTLFLSKKHFKAELHEISGTAQVGQDVEFEIRLTRTGFCFIPYIELCLLADCRINIRTSLLFSGTKTLRGSFKASHSGINRLNLDLMTIRDFAGLFNLKIPVGQEAKKAVLPKIVDYAGPEIIPSVLPSDDEDAEEGVTVVKGGLPGCEHRDYIPGDSPKRINYKLSAKRNRLLVRLDESAGFAATNIFIAENGLPECCEQAFALAKILVNKGGSVKITHKNETKGANSPETLDKLREWLAFREFAETEEQTIFTPPKDADIVFSGKGAVSA
ncbi:MAG: DUF58 domain-containing protein [Oscillospiraceae bacterium]|nr:DUF58 domain-containing protein [Oscillospiraceae bacterium]